jgi:hypothetical protein
MSIFFILLGFWIWVVVEQQQGLHTPRWVVVQFEDSVRSELGTFSGLYKLRATRKTFRADLFHWTEMEKRSIPNNDKELSKLEGKKEFLPFR